MDFIQRVGEMAKTIHWSDIATSNNFANALRGTARKWRFSMVNLETEVQLKWSDFKDQFKEEYTIQAMINSSL
jgi:hypothetical protein